QIRNLSECTSVCALVFFTHTHLSDTTLPSWSDSDDAIAFLSEVLKLEPMDFLARFEQWACTRNRGVSHVSNTVRRTLTTNHQRNISMSYIKYECDIVTKYKVELLGWPIAVKFANPSEIGTVGDIRQLRQALKVGECKWVAQSRWQQVDHAEKLAAREAAGEPGIKKRKERSDKGKMRKKGAKDSAAGTSGRKCTRDEHNSKQEGHSDNRDGDGKNAEKQPPRKK
ncbi:hypothetical protein L208DRAFT_1302540, partial [Tricholoma matsutake]